MRFGLVALVVVALAGCGGTTETTTVTRTEGETVVVTETRSETVTETERAAAGLPDAVASTHAELLSAAESGDYEALRPFPQDRFSYTFGGPAEGGPIAYWRRLEGESDDRPLEILARLLRLPYTLSRGIYVWPFAYDQSEDDLTAHERELLGDLAGSFGETGYLGWRTGIAADGTRTFFIAGD